MNGMIFLSFRKRNSSQKNTNTVYSEYSYSGIVPKERALRLLSFTKGRSILVALQTTECKALVDSSELLDETYMNKVENLSLDKFQWSMCLMKYNLWYK